MDIRAAIAHLVEGRHLSEEEMDEVMRGLMGGEATPAQIGAFLVALRIKGESVEELTGAARVMRRYATRVKTTKDVLDTCGTGGDMRGTFNISTAAALITAGAGIVVAKHGNRAMSGAVGGADVLEALGVRIDLTAEQVKACLEDVGIGFLFAPVFHPAMRHAAQARREIGVRTIFNLLGPLSNPAGARFQLLGVFNAQWLEPLARTLGRLGSRHVMVVHGDDGLDEISLTGSSQVAELRDGSVRTYRITPEELGMQPCAPEELRGGDAGHNADIIRRILAGEATRAQTDIAVVNAAAAIYVAGRAPDIREALDVARQSVSSGQAARKLEQLVELSNR
jgi:anthranilate phosphoribosyltransferase